MIYYDYSLLDFYKRILIINVPTTERDPFLGGERENTLSFNFRVGKVYIPTNMTVKSYYDKQMSSKAGLCASIIVEEILHDSMLLESGEHINPTQNAVFFILHEIHHYKHLKKYIKRGYSWVEFKEDYQNEEDILANSLPLNDDEQSQSATMPSIMKASILYRKHSFERAADLFAVQKIMRYEKYRKHFKE